MTRRAAFLVAALVASLAPAPAEAAAACGPQITAPLNEPPWPLIRLRPDLAWPLSRGAGVTVAVIDSGVSANHPALAGKVLPGLDHVQPGGRGDCDEHGHGTLIAGIIAGRETTSAGYRFHGIAPEAAIVPVRVLRDQRRSFDNDMSARIATAIRWAIDVRGADVINLSLTTLPSAQLAAAVRYARDRRVVVVAAAGNQSETARSDQPSYPAAYDGVIAVAGTDQVDKHVGTSTAGDYVDVAAPGARIAGPSPAGGGYLFTDEGGTSFAAAYVSGVAALIRAYEPDLSPQQVTQRITETADHPAETWNPAVGYGVVNPQRAVGSLRRDVAAGVVRPAQPVQPPTPRVDPLHGVMRIATWVTIVGMAVAALILVSVPIVRRGRRRGWRPG